jgi:hypothetical protein
LVGAEFVAGGEGHGLRFTKFSGSRGGLPEIFDVGKIAGSSRRAPKEVSAASVAWAFAGSALMKMSMSLVARSCP